MAQLDSWGSRSLLRLESGASWDRSHSKEIAYVSQAGIGQSRSLHEGLALQLLSALLWYQVTSHKTSMPFVSWSQKKHVVISSILKFRKQRQWEAKDMNTKRSSSVFSYSSIFLGSMLRSRCLHEVQIPMRITWCSSANGSQIGFLFMERKVISAYAPR